MNLITDPWIPVRRKSGDHSMITPAELADDDAPVALAWPRADFDLSCMEFLLGLTYAGYAPEDGEVWDARGGEFDRDDFEAALSRLAPWFEVDSPGMAFMQELDPLEGDVLGCERLLIDASGGQTEKRNADLMVKRDSELVMSQSIAAMALYTFQNFAPAGGRGNRTSMRGGGPMVTLIEPSSTATLLETLWANVPLGNPLPVDDDNRVAETFPWSAATVTSEAKSSELHEPQLPNGQIHWGAFFGMPRRIRLHFGDQQAVCGLSGLSSERPATGLVQRPYGINYGVWNHPCSPYYRTKDGGDRLPVHPKPGRFGYRNYEGVVLRAEDTNLRERASCVDNWLLEQRGSARTLPRVLVGGWAMENMRPLDFIQSRQSVPLGELSAEGERKATAAVEAAEILAGNLSYAVKQALSVEDGESGVPTSARLAFYELTESTFALLLQKLVESDLSTDPLDKWRRDIMRAAEHEFDLRTRHVVPSMKPEDARRVLESRRIIINTGLGYTKTGRRLFELLGLEPPPRKRSKKKEQTA